METENGILILIDLLGTRGMWLRNEPQKIIEKFTEIITNIDIWKSKLPELDVDIYFFSDTILMIFPIKSKNVYDILKNSYFLISAIIINGIDLGLLYRGSISYGKVYRNKNANYPLIIGPAIDEASDWYDRMEMIGIVASPSVKFLIDITNNNKENLVDSFITYEVSLKNNKSVNTWVLNWPKMIPFYCGDIKNLNEYDNKINQNKIKYKNWILEKFTELSISVYDFTKFDNTINFYDKATNSNNTSN